jgi:hypothetical protein
LDGPAVPEAPAGSDVTASVFGLAAPVRIQFCEEYPEDGTLGVQLVDRRGKQFLCGLDGGHCASVEARKQSASWPRRVFVGATYPTRAGARLLPLWGTEEKALIHLLTVAVADSISDAQNDLLLRGAHSGILSDPGSFGFLRLIGSLERRRRMLAAISQGEVAPTADALAYFGLSGPVAIRHIELDPAGRLSSVAVADTAGLTVVASAGGTGAKTGVGSWLVDLGQGRSRLYVPLGGYEERYLLTVLSAAARAAQGRGETATKGDPRGVSTGDTLGLRAAMKTIQQRKQQIREKDRFN